MDGYEWIAEAAAEERDAIARALAEDLLGASRGGRGLVRAERPADPARALGRDRRERRPQRRIANPSEIRTRTVRADPVRNPSENEKAPDGGSRARRSSSVL